MHRILSVPARMVLLLSIAFGWAPFLPDCRAADSADQPAATEPLTVWLKTGKRLKGKLDSRTNARQLWLHFGSERTHVTRRFYWEEVHEIRQQDQALPFSEVRELAGELEALPESPRTATSLEFPPAEATATEAEATPSASGGWPGSRVACILLDAQLANWDQDVEMDGLLVELWTVGPRGEYVAVDGVLQGELWAMRRIEQDSAPSSGGRVVERVERWTVPLRGAFADGQPAWVRLPFQRRHPEFDTSWSPAGLLHVALVVPGQGVFHRSLDGIRIRPFSPLRDFLEREGDPRFLPIERTGPR